MQLKYRKWEGECPQIAPQEEVWVILAIAPPDTSGQLETLVFRGICSVYSDIPKDIMSECNVESTEERVGKVAELLHEPSFQNLSLWLALCLLSC